MSLSNLPTEPEPEDWSVWTNNPLAGRWTFEFGGTRESCLRYMTQFGAGIRMWEISLRHPTIWDTP